jgi:hypothetical protein
MKNIPSSCRDSNSRSSSSSPALYRWAIPAPIPNRLQEGRFRWASKVTEFSKYLDFILYFVARFHVTSRLFIWTQRRASPFKGMCLFEGHVSGILTGGEGCRWTTTINIATEQSPWEANSQEVPPACHGTRRFTTVFIRPRHWSPSRARCIQSTYSHSISPRFIQILSSLFRISDKRLGGDISHLSNTMWLFAAPVLLLHLVFVTALCLLLLSEELSDSILLSSLFLMIHVLNHTAKPVRLRPYAISVASLFFT